MPTPCVSCRQSSSNPYNFLLPCIQCSNSWHHRCHKPPVPDSEVVDIIKLFNAKQKKGDPSARLLWKCNACVKGKAKPVDPHPQVLTARPLAVKSAVQPLRPPSSNPSGTILIEDDDDIIILDKLPTRPAPVNKQEKDLATFKPSRNVLPQERDQQVSPTSLSRDLEENNRHRARHSSATAAIGQHEEVIVATLPPAKAFPQKEFTAKKTTTLAQRPDTGILIIDDPYLASTTVSSDEQVVNKGDGDDDEPLEYLTPPQPPPVVLPPPTSSGPLIIPIDSAVSELTARLVLLPVWISSRHTVADAKPDLWERRRKALRHSNAKQIAGTSPAYDVVSSNILPTSRRKRFTAQHLNARNRKGVGQSPFFFSADEWIRQKVGA